MKARCTVDPTIEGRQFGHLEVPLQDASAFGSSAALGRSPVCIIRRGDGPVIIMIAGLQGDAPEATAALLQLANTTEADAVSGTLVILPCIDRAGHSDVVDGFAGGSAVSYAEQLAQLITSLFINNASLVMNFQSGGAHFGYAPSAAVVQQSDRDQQQRAEASMIAFGAPNSVRLPDELASGLDQACAEAGVPCIRLLLGGQGTASAEVLEIALRGCQNVFSQSELTTQELTLCATRMLEVRDTFADIHATHSGLQSSTARLGDEVWRDNVLVHISDPMAIDSPQTQLTVERDSIVLGMRQSGLCKAGDLLVLLADEVQR